MNFPTSQTPPPPSVNTPLPEIAGVPAGPGLSESQRLLNVFIAPSKTFTDIRRNASWWKPWLIATIISMAFSIIAVQKLDMMRLVQQQIEKSPSAQRRLERVPPEQRQSGMELQAKITKISFYVFPLIIGLLGGLIIAAILMFIFNFMLGAEVPFQRALAVTFYAYFPFIIKSILLCISLFAASDPNSIDITGNPMPTNPAFFMDSGGNIFLYNLLGYVDIFAIWIAVLLGLGFVTASSNRKLTAGTGITAVLAAYGLWAVCISGFRALF